MEASVSESDHACMELAIQEARKARVEDARTHPMVGAVVARARTVLGTAFRGEFALGEHAEYTLLERKLKDASLVGATVYTTLEPCTSRSHPRVPCVARLIDRRVSKVVVGMLDPNPYLSGRGLHVLRQAGVQTEFFPRALMTAVEDLNAAFLRAGKDSIPPARVNLSGWEWDVLETEGVVAGRSRQGWYEYFLATNDLSNLERLREFYTLPTEQISDLSIYDLSAGELPAIVVATDIRVIEAVTAEPSRLLSLTPRQFEQFTAELLERLGYRGVSIGRGSKDGGVDVSAYIEHALGIEKVVVQCKRQSHDNKVGEPVMKQLLTDADIQHAARGLMVTTSYLTRGARLLVETYRYRLSALDYDELLRLLRGEDRTRGAT